MRHVKMDLKVCEGCGGLWVRNRHEVGVYCRHCAQVLSEFPAARAKRPVQSVRPMPRMATGTTGGAR
jgi:hypothetical protein